MKMNAIEALENRQLFAMSLTLGPNNMYFNAVKGESQTYTLRVVNSGDTRVVISRLQIVGDDAGLFTVTDFPSTGRSLGAGAQVNYTVQFTPGSSASSSIKTATLRAWRLPDPPSLPPSPQPCPPCSPAPPCCCPM